MMSVLLIYEIEWNLYDVMSVLLIYEIEWNLHE